MRPAVGWLTILAFTTHAGTAAAQANSANSGSIAAGVPEPSLSPTRKIGFEWLSAPREIARAWSASRDTAVMDLSILPRPVHRVGGELALMSFRWPEWTVRTGIAALIELEFDGETDRFHSGPWPGATSGEMLWRGSYAFYTAVTPCELGKALCERCRLEGTLGYRHESQHYTGSNHGGEGTDASDQPYVGDDFEVDVASSQRVGAWYFAERVLASWYIPERSSYAAGSGADAHARWIVSERAHPFVSVHGEYRFGRRVAGRSFPDAYRVRALTGLALPSSLGDVMLYLSADVGHRYGLRILSEEATLGLGVRLALGTTAGLYR